MQFRALPLRYYHVEKLFLEAARFGESENLSVLGARATDGGKAGQFSGDIIIHGLASRGILGNLRRIATA
ncbi:hypothetical protein AS149_14755 [Burkholderia cenocepacia]|nr:hypothetical protein AS149_14755 [Burkholderia cenocepacia]